MKPSIGRIVHFVSHQGGHHAAIITDVYNEQEVDLNVFSNSRDFLDYERPGAVIYSETGMTPWTWHWPERE